MRYVVTVFVLAILALGVWFARDRGEMVPASGEARLAPMAVAANAQPAGAAVPAAGAREEATAGSATAVFLTDADLPLHELQLALRRTDAPNSPAGTDPQAPPDRLTDERAADGTMRHQWRGLAAGTYRLDVHCPGGARPLVAIDAIAIADGPCDDPRLAGIDLRGRLRRLRIRATAADGSAVANPDAFVVAMGPKEWHGYNLGHGEVAIVASEAVELLVVAPGHRAAVVDGVFDSRTIALEAAVPTQLTFAPPAPLPEGLRLRAHLAPMIFGDRAYLWLDTGRGMYANDFVFLHQELDVGADGKLAVRVRAQGVYRLSVLVGTDANRVSLAIAPRLVELPGSADIAVRIDAASWDRAMQELGR